MRRTTWLFLLGVVAVVVAATSIVDMFVPRPYDGVVLEADVFGELITREVVDGSGAARAGLRPGDRIVGIDRTVLRSPAHAAELLNRRQIGETVPYLVRDSEGVREVPVELGRRRIGSGSYLFACFLGFAFWIIGSFVLHRQPRHRGAQLFFVLSNLFLLFLVCRLRPASYSQIDTIVLGVGTVALLFLPACFLHFFLIFPRAVRLRPSRGQAHFARRRRIWLWILVGIYLVPPLVLLASVLDARLLGAPLPLVNGAPLANWWVLVVYMVLGLGALGINAKRAQRPRERRGALWVFLGSLFGLAPLLAFAIIYPEKIHTRQFLYFGLAPLTLVPLTFAYAIVRFQFLEVRVFLRKSLVYTLLTAVVTALYALAIALFKDVSTVFETAAGRYFPLFFALVIVLLLDPLRQRLQVVLDRFFHAERHRLEQTIMELGDTLSAEGDPQEVVYGLFDDLPDRLGLHFAALYLRRDAGHERTAGPEHLPELLPELTGLYSELTERGVRDIDRLGHTGLGSSADRLAVQELVGAGVEVVGRLATTRRQLGLAVFSGKTGQLLLDRRERELLEGLLGQMAMALETSTLLAERTVQAELERELEIAAAVQDSLLPSRLDLGPGWQVAATCRPARHVGGDFYTALPGGADGGPAIVYGDVAGKSVSGALVMMAAHEALHSLALTERDPARLLELANRRLYGLGRRRSFVALGYLAPNGRVLSYVLAGQPQPLKRSLDGTVSELPLPAHRLPLGALDGGAYRPLSVEVSAGEVVLGYSDGVVDARSPSGRSFGTERLIELLVESSGDPEVLVASVLARLDEFTEGAEPYDDITLIAIRRDEGEHHG